VIIVVHDDIRAVEALPATYSDGEIDVVNRAVCGGEYAHIGIYDDSDDICTACTETNRYIASRIPAVPGMAILDLGCGSGGLCRHLARRFGCRVCGLDLSRREIEQAIARNREEGLDDRVNIQRGTFTAPPYRDGTFDVIVSQDALLYSPDKERVLRNAHRMLKKGGKILFCDILIGSDGVDDQKRDAILSRFNVTHLETFGDYHSLLREIGFQVREVTDHSVDLATHFSRVREEFLARHGAPAQAVQGPALTAFQSDLDACVEDAANGALQWGFFVADRIG